MSPEQDEPSDLGPEASEALVQLRAGIKRARVIVREAKQAIGQRPPDGAVLSSEPPGEVDDPVIPAD
jgi:hypothetical protein